jgi:hypothetical protein
LAPSNCSELTSSEGDFVSNPHPPDNSEAAPKPVPFMACSECKAPMRDKYFALNERPICAKCKPAFAKRIERGTTGAAFWRSAFQGLGVALLGALAMGAVVTVFPFARIFVLIPIGFLVGKTVMAAVDGYGGRRYQYLAVALSYFAISIGQVVPAFREAAATEQRRAAIRADTNRTLATQGLALQEAMQDIAQDSTFMDTSDDEESEADDEADDDDNAAAPTQAGKPTPPAPESSGPRNLLVLVLFLPLLALFQGGIHVTAVGFLALGYALYQAWTRTDGHGLDLNLKGPFRVGAGPIPAR